MKLAVILLLAVSMTLMTVAAVSTVTVDTPGHIHINKGNRAGLQVTPSILDFGNVTPGDPANITVTLLNTGNCYENVTVSATVNGVTSPLLPGPLTINPAQTASLLAEYTRQMTLTMVTGDHNFDVSWTATYI